VTLFRHTAIGSTPGESWSFRVYTTSSASLSSAQATWMTALDNLWTSALDAVITPDVVLLQGTTASITESTGGQISRVSDDVNDPGVASGEMLPFQCATSVTWSTALATRAGQGRIYLPPLAVSVIDNGRLSSSAVTTIVTSVNAMWAALDTGGLALSLYGAISHTVTAVTGGNVGDVIDTQRRRRNKLIETRVSLTAP